MNLLLRASATTNRWVERSAAAIGITMSLIVILQVFCRYILNHSLFWSEELARYLLVWLTFLGASAAYYRRVHPGIDILTLRFNRKFRKIAASFVHLVSLCFFTVMIYHGTHFAYFIRAQISPALAMPKWLIFSVIPLSGTIFLLHCLAFLVSLLQEQEHDN